jgi:thiol-disulfide isomerase/thioredoxin
MHFCVVIQKPKSMRLIYFLIVCLLASACTPKPAEFKTGVWRGLIDMQGQQLPFNFEVAKDDSGYKVYLLNAEEKLLQDEITVTHDSVKIVMLIFDIELQAKINGNTLSGTYIKNYDPKNKLPFTATFGEDYRFVKKDTATANFTGKYQLMFRSEKESYPAVGVIKQEDNLVIGTFLTPTGDYRYLQGNVIENKVWLSTFDGNHAFLFSAFIDGDSLRGDFYSGKTSHETFSGIKNENAALPDLESLTFLKEGYDQISFSFPDVDNNMISPSDEKYDKKVLILQLFGTWCPNCMDETKFLAQWYKENNQRGVEILGLAYERKPDFEYASGRVKKMKEKLNVSYDFVIAGTNDKEKAAETLPMLNKVIAFPTTIFIGKDGKVKHIRTGFEGPGTGIYYEQFKERFNQIVNELLAEDLSSKK